MTSQELIEHAKQTARDTDRLILEIGYALSDSQASVLLDQIGVERDKYFQDRSKELADRGSSFVGQILKN